MLSPDCQQVVTDPKGVRPAYIDQGRENPLCSPWEELPAFPLPVTWVQGVLLAGQAGHRWEILGGILLATTLPLVPLLSSLRAG